MTVQLDCVTPHTTMENEPDPRELLLSHLDLLRQITESVCRRHNAPDLVEEFHAEVRLKLLDNDYEVLRRFRGDAQFSTYLNVVVNNFFIDYTKKHWGRFRPSTAARRLGPQAVEVETLIHRDGFSQSEAVRIAASRGPHEHQFVEESMLKLPPRRPTPREVTADGTVLELVGSEDSPEFVLAKDAMDRRMEEALERALDSLPPTDRVLLKLRYADGFSVAEIARTLYLDQKRLYRRINSALSTAREALGEAGLDRADVIDLLKDSRDLDINWRGR